MLGRTTTVEFFEKMEELVPESEKATYEAAMDRLRYEIAKSIGVRIKITKAIRPWHKDYEKCGRCGAGGVEPQAHYCWNCGTAYLKNDYTEKCVKEYEKKKPYTFEDILAETMEKENEQADH